MMILHYWMKTTNHQSGEEASASRGGLKDTIQRVKGIYNPKDRVVEHLDVRTIEQNHQSVI